MKSTSGQGDALDRSFFARAGLETLQTYCSPKMCQGWFLVRILLNFSSSTFVDFLIDKKQKNVKISYE